MKKNGKRIAAMGGILLLAALYLFTFVAAFLDIENWDRLFLASVIATIGVPILLWIYIWLYSKMTDRHQDSFEEDASNKIAQGADTEE